MARIGDIYADRDLFSQAAPYWERIPQAAPGQPGGYLEAATIYWDYFDFDNALRLLGEGPRSPGQRRTFMPTKPARSTKTSAIIRTRSTNM